MTVSKPAGKRPPVIDSLLKMLWLSMTARKKATPGDPAGKEKKENRWARDF